MIAILSISSKLCRNHALRLYTSIRFGADNLGVSTAKGSWDYKRGSPQGSQRARIQKWVDQRSRNNFGTVWLFTRSQTDHPKKHYRSNAVAPPQFGSEHNWQYDYKHHYYNNCQSNNNISKYNINGQCNKNTTAYAIIYIDVMEHSSLHNFVSQTTQYCNFQTLYLHLSLVLWMSLAMTKRHTYARTL